MPQATHERVILPAAERQRIRELIAKIGETRTARALDVARVTLARAVAGLPLHRSTADVMSARLTHPEPPEAA